ncbi:MAG: hypothetical protein R3222_10330, partial [Balneolaceae bacterium]|nr:hypothetical protein [Balneolaceae bacterium]
MKKNPFVKILAIISTVFLMQSPVDAQQTAKGSENRLIIDNFERYETGTIADTWKYITKSGDELPVREALEEGERFHVMEESGDKYLRVETQNESLRLSQVNGSSFNWNIQEYPYL